MYHDSSPLELDLSFGPLDIVFYCGSGRERVFLFNTLFFTFPFVDSCKIINPVFSDSFVSHLFLTATNQVIQDLAF